MTPIFAGRRNWAVLAAIAAIALTSGAFLIHFLDSLMDAAIARSNAGQKISAASLLSASGPTDLILFLATTGLIVRTYLWERRDRALSAFVQTMSPLEGFLLLTVVLAWCGQAYLNPGVLLGGDTGSHIARFLEIRRGIEAGALPQWTNYDFLGSSLLGFTGPFTYVLGGALDVLIRNPVATAKVILFSTHLAAGWLFYALLLRLDFKPLPSLIASISFAGSFALLHLFLFRGVFPQQFTILFLILVFYAAEGLGRGISNRGRDWLLLALASAGLIVNHQPHALFVAIYLGIFGAMSLLLRRWQWRKLWLLVTAGGMAAAIAAFAIVPILAESNWVMIVPGNGMFTLHVPTMERLIHLAMWHNTRTTYGRDYWAYLGTVLIALAAIGAWASFSRRTDDGRRRLALTLAPCAVLAFFLYNPVVRDVMFLVFFFGLYAAIGMEWALINKPGRRIGAFALLVAVLDVASTSIQPVARRDKQFMIEAGRYLEAKAPNQRILETSIDRDGSISVDIGPGSGPISYYSMVQRVAGHHDMAATLVHNYAETIAKRVQTDLRRDGHISAPNESLAGMLNVSRVICFSPASAGCPPGFKDATSEGPLGTVVHVSNATPVVFSQTLTALPPANALDKPMVEEYHYVPPVTSQVVGIGNFLDRYLDEAQLNPATHIAAKIPVREMPQTSRVQAVDGWAPRLVTYEVGLERVNIVIDTNAAGFVQLAHPWYPGNIILVNGHQVRPIEGSLGLIVLPLAAGKNVIDIHPFVTPVRARYANISLFSLVLALAVAAALGFAAPSPLKLRTHAMEEASSNPAFRRKPGEDAPDGKGKAPLSEDTAQ